MTNSSLFYVNTILSVLLVLLLAIFIVVPAPLKASFDRYSIDNNYDPATNAEVKYLYTSYKKPDNKKLLVWFQAGAFVMKNRKTPYGLLNCLNDALVEFDILTFDLPIRSSYTVRDAMLTTNELLGRFKKYDEYYAAGFSTGALLMGSFMKKEMDEETSRKMGVPAIGIRFKAIVGLCGLYSTKFDDSNLESLFKFYIMRDDSNSHLYSCSDLDVPMLVIGATSEFLYTDQTRKFHCAGKCEKKLFSETPLPHEFPLMMDLPEAKESAETVIQFLREN
ncbi:OrNVorf47-like-1 [Venturia canescens]|uniref:OrNVorf47-like-1 n=2 Tax=Venturia canescens TaxID=32260 RepID=A0ACB9ZJP3_9HYME|nr:uncharacterized LOC122409816 [Venturia canescens]AJZ73106.1 hypothetical protein [Venturia canescens]KAI5630603.1 OrNVorf47-like-1 [Venturia canescens]